MSKRETFLKNIRKMDEGGASLLLLLLISVDYAFIILHIINRMTPFDNPRLFRVDIDGSYSEFYQYAKFLWIIILLAYLIFTTKTRSYISWLLIFVYFLIDDAFHLHERLGLTIGEWFGFNLPTELRARDVGELVVFAAFGTVLMLILAWTYFRGSRSFRNVSKDLLILLAAFVFFVVVFDTAHAAVDLGSTLNATLALLEDGGEMLVTSLFVWYAFLLSLWNGEPKAYLHESFTRSTEL